MNGVLGMGPRGGWRGGESRTPVPACCAGGGAERRIVVWWV